MTRPPPCATLGIEEADHGVSCMRRLSPLLAFAAATLVLGAAASDAVAAPRGHGFRGGRIAFLGHRHHLVRHAGLNRFRHHGRFAPGAFALGGFGGWPGYGDDYGAGGGATNVAIQHNVAAAGGGYGYPSVADLPAS